MTMIKSNLLDPANASGTSDFENGNKHSIMQSPEGYVHQQAGGLYKTSWDNLADGQYSPLTFTTDRKLRASIDINAADIEIGAVELKDGSTDARGTINAANTARAATDTVLLSQLINAAGVINAIQGFIASGAADSGNPVKIGGKYTAAGVTLSDGQRGDAQLDSKGNILVSLGSLIAGENLTSNRLEVEHAYSPSAVLTADGSVKAGAGFIHTVTFSCNDAAPTAGTIDIYDNTAGSGTKIFSWTLTTAVFNPVTIILDIAMATGIYVDFTTVADVGVQVSFR